MFEIIAVIAFLGVLYWLFTRPLGRPAPLPERRSRQLQQIAREIGRTQERIDALERMLTDIDLCRPDELLKSFRCEWESGGSSQVYDFLIDGISPTSEDMYRMARAELDRLTAHLLDLFGQAERLRRRLNVYQTMDSAPAGEWYDAR